MKTWGRQITAICLIACSLVACARDQKAVRPQQYGRMLEEQGDYLNALKYYQALKDRIFQDTSIRNLRYLYGDILDALIAQQTDPNAAGVHYALGRAYYEKARSIPSGQSVTPNQGFDSDRYFAEQRQQLQTSANTELGTAIQQRPDDQEAVLLQGKLAEDMRQPDAAIAVYQRLIDLDTTSPEPMYRLALLLSQSGKAEQGLKLAQQAAAQYPKHPDTHFVLGLLSGNANNDEQAIREFQQTLCVDQTYLAAYEWLSQLYLQQNNLIDAERVLRFGAIRNPDAIRLNMLYKALSEALNLQEQTEADNIYQLMSAAGINASADAGTQGQSSDVPQAFQLRLLRLRLNAAKRQQPYSLSCPETDTPPHPYFTRQIRLLQERIDRLEQQK